MEEIMVYELPEYAGPGDIVGAFTNEVGIDGKMIGNIEIHDEKATVELHEDVVDEVIEVMDGNSVAGQKVRLRRIDPEIKRETRLVDGYVGKFRRLVQLEREEEMRQHEYEIEKLSGREREEKGRAVLCLRGRGQGEALGGKYLVKYLRQRRGEPLPKTEIGIGDLVMISRGDPLQDDNPTGTVAEKTRYSVTVAFDREPPKFALKKGLRIDLYVNDITFQRMLAALTAFEKAEGACRRLRSVLLGLKEPEFQPVSESNFFDEGLNDSQKEGVKRALSASDFFLIYGPPGTGKTRTLLEIAHQLVDRGESVLATADSNTAVDNMVERLAERGLDVVRVGHPLRVSPVLRKHTLDYLAEEHPSYRKAQRLREEVAELKDRQDELTHPSGRWRRGMSNDQIRNLAAEDRGLRGVPADKISEMAKWLEVQQDVDRHFEEIDALEEKAVDEIISSSDVVCATNSTAGSELLFGRRFDSLLHDEATQSTQPSSLIPLIHARRVILAGDHRQLPPTILNQEAEKKGLNRTLFEHLIEIHGKDLIGMLRTQYRMNEKIMGFSNREFYYSRLEADSSVRDHTLAGLGIEFDGEQTQRPAEIAIAPEWPIVMLDTSNMNAPERTRPGSTSKENPVEADFVREIIDELLARDFPLADIAVISPYDDQVDHLHHLLEGAGEELEIDTVDGFQGREKEVVIVSLVRSNQNHQIGFLKDLRRLNVSLTRARRKLIVIGDSDTIGHHETYRKLVEYIEEEGNRYIL